MTLAKLALCNPHFKLLNALNFIKTVLIQSLSTVITVKNLLMGYRMQDLSQKDFATEIKTDIDCFQCSWRYSLKA